MGVISPWMRMIGGAPVVMCRSEAPCSFTSFRIASMRAMRAPAAGRYVPEIPRTPGEAGSRGTPGVVGRTGGPLHCFLHAGPCGIALHPGHGTADNSGAHVNAQGRSCLLYTSPSPRDS